MIGKHASLLTARARAALDHNQPLEWRDMVRVVYPRISEAANRGDDHCLIHAPINDRLTKRLRDEGYVVRFQRVYGAISNVALEWGDQCVFGPQGHPIRISPIEYNLDWEKYERQRNQHITA